MNVFKEEDIFTPLLVCHLFDTRHEFQVVSFNSLAKIHVQLTCLTYTKGEGRGHEVRCYIMFYFTWQKRNLMNELPLCIERCICLVLKEGFRFY